MTAISLGMPAVPTKLADRRVSRKIQVGSVAVGGDSQISVQSMTTTRTSDIGATLQQIAELTASGCDIVRVACPTQDPAPGDGPGPPDRPRPFPHALRALVADGRRTHAV
ncbi:flavodoxin-dependent (E)-4-hydroxy-3-methylbut-2-enyl-diphosphate synthase, partial [Streptomyces xanthophaeus]|uniref:flavodoxin-dependent (E)-4-hydroxy-3-methylbut-2-enyl-diphosphate synthase n=1 Tax=Streptomyces xanthophaeus TaxID=67385 RepID=UPI00364AE57C